MKKNSITIRRVMSSKRYEGMCIGIADGRVVSTSRSIGKVMDNLIEKHREAEISLVTVPKKNKVLVL